MGVARQVGSRAGLREEQEGKLLGSDPKSQQQRAELMASRGLEPLLWPHRLLQLPLEIGVFL